MLPFFLLYSQRKSQNCMLLFHAKYFVLQINNFIFVRTNTKPILCKSTLNIFDIVYYLVYFYL